MIKKFFFVALICALVGCQKETVKVNNKKVVSSFKLSKSLDQKDLPLEVRDVIANGGDGHFDCEISTNRESVQAGLLGGGSIFGSYAYPYTLNLRPIKLFNSSLPCQPNIPYFVFGYIDEGGGTFPGEYSITFHLVLNPSYNNAVKIFDVNWGLNGQNDSDPVGSFTIDNLQIGQSNSVICEIFSTDNDIAVYSKELPLDFEISLNPGGDLVIEYSSDYTFACASGGTFPIIAP